LELDRQLSTSENKVFHNKKTGKTIVANRGTQGTIKDWKNNLEYVKGNYGKTKRQKNAVKTQKKAIEKYGKVNTNVGHSQGAKVARVMNDKKLTGEVIQVNPATKNEKSNNFFNIRFVFCFIFCWTRR
jgi:S-adenosylmethionine hydrolase